MKVLGVSTEIAVIGSRDQRIAQIAGHQRGRIAQHQLLALGVAYSAIRWMAARDRLFRLHRGVFAVGHLAPIELGAETAALLAVGDGAVLGSWSAARLWGLSPHSGDGLIHVVISGRRGPTLPGVAVHRTRILDQRDVRIRAGCRSSPPPGPCSTSRRRSPTVSLSSPSTEPSSTGSSGRLR